MLLAEVLGFLGQGPGLYLDATLGDGGHAEALLDREPGARLLGSDRDPRSLDAAREHLARFGARVTLVHATFRELPDAHVRLGGESFVGALLDLGLSSRQIDTPGRGMSFMVEEPLDLRMDGTQGVAAAERLEHVTDDVLEMVLRKYGDVSGARRLARAMTRAARSGELTTTVALRALVDRALGGRPHPRRYAQVFQALRIWVNDEAQDLQGMLDWLPDAMRAGGVVVTLAYHSGEDRRIKQALRGERSTLPARRRPGGPTERLPEGPWQELTRKVVLPSDEETASNPRARSARLRAFRRKPA